MARNGPKLSVMITGQDVAGFLPRVLDNAARVADEIVFVDGGSRDGTLELASQAAKVRVVHRAFDGNIAAQKNFGIEQCTGDWIMVLDADELMSDRLCRLIPRLVRSWFAHWYKLPRYWVLEDSSPLRYVDSRRHYPDHQLRLFRNLPVFRYTPDRPVHVHFPKRGRGFGKRLNRGHIIHFKFALTSREELDRTVLRYQSVSPKSSEINLIYDYESIPHEIRTCEESISEGLGASSKPRS